MDLRAINQYRFDEAKTFWGASVLVKFLTFVFGAVTVFIEHPPAYTPQLLLISACLSELLQWRSDFLKGQSEGLLRKLDVCKSFQKELSETDKREIVADLPHKVRAQFSVEANDKYFASTTPPGPRRSVENLLESAWYTRKQCVAMTIFCIVLIVVLLTTSLFALFIASKEVKDVVVLTNISKAVTSWLLLVFSLGVFKNAWGYYKMYQRCLKTENNAEHLLGNENVLEADAIKQWYEYQIARSSAPLLPGWLWSLMKDSLDDAWKRASS